MKLKDKLLVLLYDIHVEKKGQHISSVATTRTHLSDPVFTEKFPELIEWKNENTFEKQTIKYALDLVVEGMIKREGTEIWLTDDGYRRAEELKNIPLTFWKKYWMWIIGTLIAVAGILTAALS